MIIKYKRTPEITAVVVPGRRSASILLGVLRIVDRIKESAIINIGRSKFPTEKSNFPVMMIFRALKNIRSNIEKTNSSSLGITKGLEETEITTIGNKNTRM